MQLPIALSSYNRNDGFLPELRLRNLYLEQTPASDTGIVLLPRPGLKTFATVSGAAVQGLAAVSGTFSGDVISVASGTVSRNGATIGSASYGTTVSFAATPTEMVFASGNTLYRTDGVSVTVPFFPDGAGVTAVTVLNSTFIAVKANSSQFYWSSVLNGRSWPALNFASAESQPDNLLDCMVVNDELVLLGESSIEYWQATGDLSLPFQRIEGRTHPKGVINTGAAAPIDNSLFWCGNDGIVYRSSSVPVRISDHGIEEQIVLAGSGNVKLFSFIWTGHTFAVLDLPQATYFFDVETKEWSEASTLGIKGWRVQCACMQGTRPLLGDSLSGTIYTLDDTVLSDGGRAIERRFTVMLPQRIVLAAVNLDAQAGIGTTPTGRSVAIEMSISRDGGQTYANFAQASLGMLGQYRARASWRRCGKFDFPGGILDFRTTDPAPFSVQGVFANESLGGRSR